MQDFETIRSFSSLEEAYAALPVEEQEKGIRGMAYARELFLQLCSLDLYPDNTEVNGLLLPDLADTIGVAAKYLSIGKAMLPPLYHTLRPDFTAEELAVYHAIQGESAKLVDGLVKGCDDFAAANKKMAVSIIKDFRPWWEDLQTPSAPVEESNILNRVMAVAMAMNHYATSIHAEKPMEEALRKLGEIGQGHIDPLVLEAANSGKTKLRRVFQKFITQSRAIPVTDSMIRYRASRPFSLYYRPVAGVKERGCVAFESKCMVRENKQWYPLETAAHIIKQENIAPELALYYLTELCDMHRRLETCQIPAQYIALEFPATVMNRRGVEKQVAQRMELAEIPLQKLCVLVPKEQWQEPKKNAQENWKKLSALGVKVQLQNLALEDMNPEQWKEWGITHLSFGGGVGKSMSDATMQGQFKNLTAQGFVLLTDGLEKKSHMTKLSVCTIWGNSGVMVGDYQSQDDTIRTQLVE